MSGRRDQTAPELRLSGDLGRPVVGDAGDPPAADEVISPQFQWAVARVFDDAEAVLLSKHQDYGPDNIALAPGGALNGIRVRVHDKISRINHLLDRARDPNHEALADSWLDLLNYAAIAVLVLRGEWPA